MISFSMNIGIQTFSKEFLKHSTNILRLGFYKIHKKLRKIHKNIKFQKKK